MNRPMNLVYRLIVCFSLAVLTSAGAQEKMVRTDLMPVGLGGPLVAWYWQKGKAVKLEAFETAMGSPVFYRGPSQLNLYKSAADAKPRAEDEKPIPPLAKVVLPAGSRRVLLLCVTPKPGAKPMLKAYGVSDNSLKAGDYRFFNFSSSNVVGVIGGKKIALRPGKTMDVSSSDWRDKGRDLEVQLGYMEGKETILVYSTIWGHSEARRNYIFLVASGDESQPLDVRKFHDIPGVESIGYEPEEKAASTRDADGE